MKFVMYTGLVILLLAACQGKEKAEFSGNGDASELPRPSYEIDQETESSSPISEDAAGSFTQSSLPPLCTTQHLETDLRCAMDQIPTWSGMLNGPSGPSKIHDTASILERAADRFQLALSSLGDDGAKPVVRENLRTGIQELNAAAQLVATIESHSYLQIQFSSVANRLSRHSY